MVGSSFFRTQNGKCPNCGRFGNEEDDVDGKDGMVCPGCETVFNRYLILQPGEDVEFKNN